MSHRLQGHFMQMYRPANTESLQSTVRFTKLYEKGHEHFIPKAGLYIARSFPLAPACLFDDFKDCVLKKKFVFFLNHQM